MLREDAVKVVKENAQAIRGHGVAHLALFGSIARGDTHPDSDIDVVVDLEPGRKFSLLDLSGLRLLLYELFGQETDVVIREDLKPKFRARIAADEVSVF